MRRLILGLFISVATILAGSVTVYAFPDANLGDVSPRNGNSGFSGGEHVHFLRNGDKSQGIQDEVRLKAYYPDNVSDWNTLYFEFSPGAALTDTHVCNTEGNAGTQNNKFVHVILSTNADTKTYYVERSRVCVQKSGKNNTGVDSSNAFYARYDLPSKPSLSTITNMYEVDIQIIYDSTVPNGANGVRFRAAGPNGNPKIGPIGGDGRSFPVLGDWSIHANETLETYITVPFGASCDAGDKNNQKIRIYDADNGPGGFSHDVVLRVKNIDTGAYEKFVDWNSAKGGKGSTYDGDTRYQPPNGAADAVGESWVVIDKMYVGQRYQVEIRGLNPRNTIDIGVPGDTIFGDISCGNAKLIPQAGPDTTVEVNTPFTFENWVDTKKTDSTGTDTFRIKINDVGAQSLPGDAPYGWFDRQLNPDRVVPDGKRLYSFTPTAVGEYCLETKISNYPNYVTVPKGETAKQCLTVVNPPPIGDEQVEIKPVVELTGGDQVEADDTTVFRTYAEISNYPNFNDDEWGYTDTAVKAAALNMVQNPTYSGTRTGTDTHYGTVMSGSCKVPGTKDPVTGITGPCKEYYPDYCSAGSMPDCAYTVYEYDCQAVDSGWTTDTSWTCRDRYICHTQYDGYYASQPTCNYWKCQYGASAVKNADIFGQYYGPMGWPSSGEAQPFYDTGNPGSGKCQARCNSGTGDIAGQAVAGGTVPDGSAWDGGDLHCYERPSFTVRCTSSALPTSSGIVDIVTDDTNVNREGRACSTDATHKGTNIGDYICMRLTPGSAAWNVLDPVNGTGVNWTFRYAPASDEECKKVIGKSYVRVVGGDAASGSGATTSANLTCSLGTGNISAWNDTANGNKGSGASVAVFANGLINGFVSGQFATPVLGGYNARPNTFANTNGSPFGGQWGGAPPCINTEKIDYTSTSASMPTTVTGVDKRKILNQDVFISSNITYSTAGVDGIPGWQSVEDLPLFQLVVEGGDIYITNTVTQIDGLYVAVKNATYPSKGNIYTCSTGSGSHVTATWSNCKRQLVVNGSLVAEKVFFARDCSTLKRAQSNEKTVFTGGTDEQFCNTASPGTRAAEVINYTPDIWIRSTLGVPSTNYDAVTTLPPVL